jgi:hypothetical protein
MAVIVDKLHQLESDVAELRQTLADWKRQIDGRVALLDSTDANLSLKLDEVANTVDAILGHPTRTSDRPAPVQGGLQDDGTLLIEPRHRSEFEAKGYAVIGTLSRDCQVYLKMVKR